MARRKRVSKVLEKADKRLSGLKSIDAALDLGGGLTVKAYEVKIEALREQLSNYNQLLSDIDTSNNTLIAPEKEMRDLNERMLSGVGTHYGKDSSEYEAAGGVRKSERKKPKRKPKAKA